MMLIFYSTTRRAIRMWALYSLCRTQMMRIGVSVMSMMSVSVRVLLVDTVELFDTIRLILVLTIRSDFSICSDFRH